MAKKPDKEKDIESEVWSAIQAFEQILEAMPTDRASLEALSHAYEQIGDHTRAKDYCIRLGKVLLDEGDTAAARDLLEKLRSYAASEPAAKSLVARIEETAAADKRPAAEPEIKTGRTKAEIHARSAFNISEELSFAWNLMEAKELTQEEYASVVQDLTDMSSVEGESTVSVLHVLETKAFKNLERVIGFASRQSETPIISLASFDVRQEPLGLLPVELMQKRGVMVFELIGKDALVVVMNPYDKQFRKELEQILNRKCHFYMALASEFDRILNNYIEALADKAAEEEKEKKGK